MHVRLSAILAMVASAALAQPAPLTWNDALRDVYVDGALVRGVQTLTTESPKRLALVLDQEVLLFDPATKQLSRAARNAFAFAPDRTSATTPADLATEAIGTFVMPDEASYLARRGDQFILIAAHQSHAGTMTEEELWRTAPVWREIMDRYTPDADAIRRLKAVREPATIEIVFATWCGDSKHYVPRLLKALHEAANPHLSVELFGLGPRFLSPMDVIQSRDIINVPTVIVSRAGHEIGRYIETPATPSIEADVAAILDHSPLSHRGRWERNALIASGDYSLRDAGGQQVGTESFELFEAPKHSLLLHSTIEWKEEHRRVETWATLDEERMPDHAEVTEWRGDRVTRTRYARDGSKWSAHSRGEEGGIIDQVTSVPERFSLVTPATLTLAWPLMGSHVQPHHRRTYVVTERSTHGLGGMAEVEIRPGPAQFLPLAEKRLQGETYVFRSEKLNYRLIAHSDLNVPLLVHFTDGTERRLVHLRGDLPRAALLSDGQ